MHGSILSLGDPESSTEERTAEQVARSSAVKLVRFSQAAAEEAFGVQGLHEQSASHKDREDARGSTWMARQVTGPPPLAVWSIHTGQAAQPKPGIRRVTPGSQTDPE